MSKDWKKPPVELEIRKKAMKFYFLFLTYFPVLMKVQHWLNGVWKVSIYEIAVCVSGMYSHLKSTIL